MAKLITSVEFLLKMRSMEMHNRKIMQKFLKFLVAHVKFDVRSSGSGPIKLSPPFHSSAYRPQNYRKEFEEINEQLLRLETLGLIDVYECDLQWQKFVNHSNLISYCFKFFETVGFNTFLISSIISFWLFLGCFEGLFNIASACVEHFAQSQGHHRAQDDEHISTAYVTV